MLPVVIVTVAGLLPYVNSLPGSFVFDDTNVVVKAVEQVRHGDWTLSGSRPVVRLSFKLSAILVGEDPPAFRAVNVLIHTLAGLLLFAIVRRVAERSPHFDQRPYIASWLAAAVAVLWLVHPLNTQAVTYIVQRAESLMGLFYLLTIYFALRAGLDDRSRWVWAVAAVGACTIGMGTKPVMASAPIVALLFDRAFVAGSFVEALRRRWVMYAGLFAAWGPLLWLNVTDIVREKGSAGFGMESLSEMQYLLSQGEVVTHYLRLSFWPWPLVLDYQWFAAARIAWQAWLPGVLFISGLLGVCLAGVIRNHWWGFCGAWFFLILGPTSSFMPIADLAVEHRMYLPLIGLVALVVFGGDCLLRRLVSGPAGIVVRALVLLVVAGFLVTLTVRRNSEYIDRVTMWSTVVERAPINPRGHHNLAKALYEVGDFERSMHHYRMTLQILPDDESARNGIGNVWMQWRSFDKAIAWYQSAVQLQPNDCEFVYNLGRAYWHAKRLDDAESELNRAIDLKPHYPKAYNMLGLVDVSRGNFERAVGRFRTVIKMDPEPSVLLDGYNNLSAALADLGRFGEAADTAGQALRLAKKLGLNPVVTNRLQQRITDYRRKAAPTPGVL